MKGLKEKTVDFICDAEDVYDALKELTREDDLVDNHGLFKIDADKKSDTAKVSYIDQHSANALSRAELRKLLDEDGWYRYHNDYVICSELYRIFGRL
jgi:hypothetical protein